LPAPLALRLAAGSRRKPALRPPSDDEGGGRAVR
jgi:hypothetical protein